MRTTDAVVIKLKPLIYRMNYQPLCIAQRHTTNCRPKLISKKPISAEWWLSDPSTFEANIKTKLSSVLSSSHFTLFLLYSFSFPSISLPLYILFPLLNCIHFLLHFTLLFTPILPFSLFSSLLSLSTIRRRKRTTGRVVAVLN
jgi:hypothetical protein